MSNESEFALLVVVMLIVMVIFVVAQNNRFRSVAMADFGPKVAAADAPADDIDTRVFDGGFPMTASWRRTTLIARTVLRSLCGPPGCGSEQPEEYSILPGHRRTVMKRQADRAKRLLP